MEIPAVARFFGLLRLWKQWNFEMEHEKKGENRNTFAQFNNNKNTQRAKCFRPSNKLFAQNLNFTFA